MKTVIPLSILYLLLSGSPLFAQQAEASHYCRSILALVDSAIARQQLDTALVRLQDVEICDYQNILQTERGERQSRIFAAIKQQKDAAEIERTNAEKERANAIAARNRSQGLQKELQKSLDELKIKEDSLAATLQAVEQERDAADRAKRRADTLATIANEERDRAQEQETIARARAMLAQAQALYDQDNTLALNLAMASRKLADTEEAKAFTLGILSKPESFFYQKTFNHSSGITCLAFSSNGDKMISSALDGSVKIWDTETGALLDSLAGHKNPVRKAVFSPQDDKIVTMSVDSVKIWDVYAKKTVYTRAQEDKRLRIDDKNYKTAYIRFSGVQFSGDGDLVLIETEKDDFVDYEGGVSILDARDGYTQKKFISSGELPDGGSHLYRDYVLVFNKKRKVKNEQYDDKKVQVYDLRAKKYIAKSTLKDSKNTFRRWSLSPDGRKIIANSYNGFVGVWDLKTGKLVFNLLGHDTKITTTSGVFSSDGTQILTASFDGTVKLWNAETGALLQTMNGHSEGWLLAEFSPDRKKIITASQNGQGRIWNPEPSMVYTYPDYSLEDKKLQKLIRYRTQQEKGQQYLISAIGISPLEDKMALKKKDEIQIVNSVTGKKIAGLKNGMFMYRPSPGASGFNVYEPIICFPESNKIMIGAQVREAGPFGGLLYALPDHVPCSGKNPSEPAFSKDRTKGILGSDGRHPTIIWALSSGATLHTLDTSCMRAAAFFPGGDKIATAYANGTIGIWDLPSERRIQTIVADSFPVEIDESVELAVSPGADSLVVLRHKPAGKDSTLIRWETWDLTAGRRTGQHSLIVLKTYDVTISPDASETLIAFDYMTALVYDVSTGTKLATIELPSNYTYFTPFHRVAYSPEGDKIILAAAERWARSIKYAKIRNYFWEWKNQLIYTLNEKEREAYGIEGEYKEAFSY